MRLHESALWLRCASVLAAVALSSASLSGAQQATGGVRSVTAADYEHAEKFLPFNISPHVFHKVHATWLAGDRFWYRDAANELRFRYMYSSGPTTDPLSSVGANVPGFPVGVYDRAQNFVAQETHTFSSSMIGVARFSYLRNQFLLDEHINHELPSALVRRSFKWPDTLP
jgi:hypothetical protein